MLRIAQLDIRRTGNRRARIDQVGGIEDASAILALIAAGTFVSAMPAGTDDIAIREKPFVVDRVNLGRCSLGEEVVLIELMIKVLGDLVVLRRMRTPEMIEGETKAIAEILLDRVHLRAVLVDRKTGFMRRELSRRAVFVRCADKEDLIAARTLEARIGVRRQHGADKVAEMFDPVDIGQSG